jgi:hypothetical protein
VLLFEIGHRVNLRWLRANPALLGMSLLESALGFGAVWITLVFLGFTALQSAIVAGLLMATSPAVCCASAASSLQRAGDRAPAAALGPQHRFMPCWSAACCWA